MFSFWVRHKEAILYIVFGCLTTLVNWIVYSLFIRLFEFDVTTSNLVACTSAIIFAFITNKLFVFERKSFAVKTFLNEMLSFLMVRGFTGLIEVFMPLFLIKVGLNQSLFGIEALVAKMIATFVVIILNYILSKFFVFKK